MKPMTVNTGLGAPLLSRFDLILVLRDTCDPLWDQLVATHILEDAMRTRNAATADAWLAQLPDFLRSLKLSGHIRLLSVYFQ